MRENKFSPRIFYTTKLSFKIDRAIKTLHHKQKLKYYMTTKPPLQIQQGILHTEDERKQYNKRTVSIMPQERKDK
jgi:hypothetical protein